MVGIIMNHNYNEFDYQTIVVRKDKIEQVVSDYACFGWLKIEEQQHLLYENLLEVKFQRKHKIKNKDDLQFMQVNYEYYTNLMARSEKNKYKKSLIFGLSILVLLTSLISLAILSFQYFNGTIRIILASIAILFALVFVILTCLLQPKLIKKEKLIYKQRMKECKDAIDKICGLAKELI